MSWGDDVRDVDPDARAWGYGTTCTRCLDPIPRGAPVAHVRTPSGELAPVHPECVTVDVQRRGTRGGW